MDLFLNYKMGTYFILCFLNVPLITQLLFILQFRSGMGIINYKMGTYKMDNFLIIKWVLSLKIGF